MIKTSLITAALLSLSFCAAANWSVNSDNSNVSFVSVKKGDVAEVHRFKQVSGSFADDGKFYLTIPLASIDSGIEIRDERMKTMLFNVEQFPSLALSAQVDAAKVSALAVGSVMQLETQAEITLHGKTDKVNIDVAVARLADNRLMVSSVGMVIINASSFGLTDGIEKLREVAGLSAISKAVPVSFNLVLEK
ncbi:YceI family protein [Shewanella sp. JM162201]|uniref:YceI family protein n=1 Tax=Shewanella jiangmenensis TaxID=2837387 RepID=A0ABS5V579_9GAMM|nr:YceI family protein [Shewanella jiangmenensis]MBT1445608.1 YceI family protein [Shewanella jiangmenensis]